MGSNYQVAAACPSGEKVSECLATLGLQVTAGETCFFTVTPRELRWTSMTGGRRLGKRQVRTSKDTRGTRSLKSTRELLWILHLEISLENPQVPPNPQALNSQLPPLCAGILYTVPNVVGQGRLQEPGSVLGKQAGVCGQGRNHKLL